METKRQQVVWERIKWVNKVSFENVQIYFSEVKDVGVALEEERGEEGSEL